MKPNNLISDLILSEQGSGQFIPESPSSLNMNLARKLRPSKAWVFEEGGGAHLHVACTRGLAPVTNLHQ